MNGVRAAVFDMDGLILDSEPFWQQAERSCFAEVGITVTEAMARVTAPMTTAQVAAHWFAHQPWPNRSTQDLEHAVIERVRALISQSGRALPGVQRLLDACGRRRWPTALASNSPLTLCEHVLNTLQLRARFAAVLSAEQVPQGKPAPDIYLEAARRLGVAPAQCLAFEDSVSGARAARTAGCIVVAIPSAGQCFEAAGLTPDASFASLDAFCEVHGL